MGIDDDPIIALERQFEMENLSVSPVTKAVLAVSSYFTLVWPVNKAVDTIKNHLSADSLERIRLLVETLANEIRGHDAELKRLQEKLPTADAAIREEVSRELLIDASRKASRNRSKDRISRIGVILTNGIVQPEFIDADEIEEMMRIAVELSDREVDFLRELIRIEGEALQAQDHLPRYDAYTRWEQGRWGASIDPEIDSVFSKLESYGLVARLAPPSNLNIMADFQNRYVLLKKGLRFSRLAKSSV